jgi:hypothetical protein
MKTYNTEIVNFVVPIRGESLFVLFPPYLYEDDILNGVYLNDNCSMLNIPKEPGLYECILIVRGYYDAHLGDGDTYLECTNIKLLYKL